MTFKGRKPLLIALASQLAAILIPLAVIQIHHTATGTDFSIWVKLAMACGSAGIVAMILRAGLAWAGFLSVLPALFVGALALDLPVWLPAGILLLLVLLLRNSLGERVPLYLTNRETLDKLGRFLPEERPVAMVDLGCGFAAVPIGLSRRNNHPESRFVGVENAPLPYALSKILAWMNGDPRVEIRLKSLWSEDLGAYDLVYAFLSPHPMQDLYDKASREMQPGARFVSNSFAVPTSEPDETVPIESGRATGLLVWRMTGVDCEKSSAQG